MLQSNIQNIFLQGHNVSSKGFKQSDEGEEITENILNTKQVHSAGEAEKCCTKFGFMMREDD